MKNLLASLLSSSFLLVAACGGSSAKPPAEPSPTPVAGECVKGGCSGTVCADASAEPVITTCEYKNEYACYQTATCAPQPDGACGWTPTPELAACISAGGPAEAPADDSSY